MSDFSQKLKNIRLESNSSQVKIANSLNVPVSTYANWEQGRREPSISDLSLIGRLFNVSIDYLLGIEDEFGSKAAYELETSKDEATLLKCFRGADDVGKRSILIAAQAFYAQAQENGKSRA